MATSRTGTASHINWRRKVLTRDQANGITHCPICHTKLDYENSRQPNSAEADHIKPWANGGTNTLDNGRTICRQCNQKRGANQRRTSTRNTPATVFRSVSNEGW